MKNLKSKKFLTMVALDIIIFIGIFSKLFFTDQIIPPGVGLPAIVAISGWWFKQDVEEKRLKL